jgi:adenylyl-sulfate kinase
MKRRGFVVWFTGLPSSGKSTLSLMVQRALDEAGFAVEILDGDEIRQRLTKGLGFSKEDRDENVRRISYVAKRIANVGGVAVTAAISPFREARERARAEIGNFVEVYVDCPLQVCMQRDVKGLYARAIRGEIANFTGISDPYEPPLQPEVVVHTDRESHEESLRKILQKLVDLNWVPGQIGRELFTDKPNLPDDQLTAEARPAAQWTI